MAGYIWYLFYSAAESAIARDSNSGAVAESGDLASKSSFSAPIPPADGIPVDAQIAPPAPEAGLRGSASSAPGAPSSTGDSQIAVRPAINIPPVPRSGVPSHWTPVNVGGGRDPAVTLCKLDYDSYWRHPDKLPMFKDLLGASKCHGKNTRTERLSVLRKEMENDPDGTLQVCVFLRDVAYCVPLLTQNNACRSHDRGSLLDLYSTRRDAARRWWQICSELSQTTSSSARAAPQLP